MKSSWGRMGPSSNMAGVLIKRGHMHTETCTQKRISCEDRGRDLGHATEAKE